MGIRDYELQWQRIMDNNMFSEPAVITDGETIHLSVRGVFCSGSYEEDSPAPYSPKRLVAKECFQLASSSVPEQIPNPWDAFEGMDLLLVDRNLAFRIHDVSGKRGGTLTLHLKEKNNGEES